MRSISLRKDIKFFIFLFYFSLIIFFIGNIFSTNNNIQKKIIYEKTHIANTINSELKDILLQNESFLNYLAEIIKKYDCFDKQDHILNLLLSTADLKIRSLTSSYISWADPNGKITITGKSGLINDQKYEIKSRKYFDVARKTPWKLKLSDISKSIFSSKYILPTAFGVTDKNNNFRGYLILGLSVNELIKMLKRSSKLDDYKFLIEFNSFGQTLSSDELDPFKIKKKNDKNEIEYNGSSYVLMNSIPEFDINIYIGEKKWVYFSNIINDTYQYLLMIIFISTAFIIFYFFYNNHIVMAFDTINNAFMSSNSVEKRKKLKIKEMDVFLNKIEYLNEQNIELKTCLKKEKSYNQHMELSYKEREKHYKEIISKIKKKINYVANNILNETQNEESVLCTFIQAKKIISEIMYTSHSFFDINSTIEECLNFYSIDIYFLDFKIKKRLSSNIKMYCGDRLKLKNIIMSIIKQIIEIAIGNQVPIEICSYTEKNLIKITISCSSTISKSTKNIFSDDVFDVRERIDKKKRKKIYTITIEADDLGHLIVYKNTNKNNIVNFKDYKSTN